jgi:hypothetical protein
LVARGLRLFSIVPRLCTSKVTYQVYVIFHESFRTLRHVRLESGMCAPKRMFAYAFELFVTL